MKVCPPVFMHRPVQRKSAAAAAHGPRASREKISLLDCTGPCRSQVPTIIFREEYIYYGNADRCNQ